MRATNGIRTRIGAMARHYNSPYTIVAYYIKFGADDETRTRDPHLGKVMRYQLRYIRVMFLQLSYHT